MLPLSPAPLTNAFDVAAFDCGDQALNDYLRKHALRNNQNSSARTYVSAEENRVVGYYTLAAGSVSRGEVPHRVAKGLGNYPVSVILLARLAVDQTKQGMGIGKALLKDALLRVVQASELVGCRAVLVHAKDERAKGFYVKFGFESSPIDEFHLCLLVKDIKANLSEP